MNNEFEKCNSINTKKIVLLIATTFSSIANPLACLVSLYFSRPAVHGITTMFTLTSICSAYIVITAVTSPTPPLHKLAIGNYLIVSLSH